MRVASIFLGGPGGLA